MKSRHTACTQSGFTLIESLAAFVLLAMGLLGMISLTSTGLAANKNVSNRMSAVYLAEDLLDRMRANQMGVNNKSYHEPAASDAVDCLSNECSSAEMAVYDFTRWHAAVEAQLPRSSGMVCIDSTPATKGCDGDGSQYTVKIWWDETPFKISEDDEPSYMTSAYVVDIAE